MIRTAILCAVMAMAGLQLARVALHTATALPAVLAQGEAIRGW